MFVRSFAYLQSRLWRVRTKQGSGNQCLFCDYMRHVHFAVQWARTIPKQEVCLQDPSGDLIWQKKISSNIRSYCLNLFNSYIWLSHKRNIGCSIAILPTNTQPEPPRTHQGVSSRPPSMCLSRTCRRANDQDASPKKVGVQCVQRPKHERKTQGRLDSDGLLLVSLLFECGTFGVSIIFASMFDLKWSKRDVRPGMQIPSFRVRIQQLPG